MSGRDDGCRIKERLKGTGVEGEGLMSYKERYRSTVVEDERIIVHRSHRLLKTMTPCWFRVRSSSPQAIVSCSLLRGTDEMLYPEVGS